MTNLIFVYGTLKRGFTNYERYLGVAVASGGATFVGEGMTSEPFPLVIRPAHMPPTTCGPVLMDQAEGHEGNQIIGEVFRVDDRCLEAMDVLEGVKSGYYYKRSTSIRMEDAILMQCDAYFYPPNGELLALPLQPAYTAEHHALYQPGPVNQQILALCQGASRHGLSTTVPCPMAVHCLRLLPGDDVLTSLQAFIKERGISAAAILSCVGSTGQTVLRPAGVPAPRTFSSKYEILSLSGTFGAQGHHLHMSISDPDCAVFGGHVMKGCLVRTTAEIVLGEIQGVRFSRPQDPRTGYDELSIDMIACDTSQSAAKRLKQ